MITQLCFPSCIMHVRISLGAQPHFLARCNSGEHYYSSKALLIHYGPGLREACVAHRGQHRRVLLQLWVSRA